MVTKENWFDLVPNEELPFLPELWGLKQITFRAPYAKGQNLQYFIRRLRNGLGHANFQFVVPDTMMEPKDLHTHVGIIIRDVDPRNSSDIFEVELKLIELEKLIQQFHSLVYKDVTTRHGIKSPPAKPNF